MALSLNDVKKNTDKKKQDLFDQKEKVLRPWQTFDQMGMQTRTSSAQEAVKRARRIVEKNNDIVSKLRDGTVDDTVIEQLDSKIQDRDKNFEDFSEQFPLNHQISSQSKLKSFFRSVFGGQ